MVGGSRGFVRPEEDGKGCQERVGDRVKARGENGKGCQERVGDRVKARGERSREWAGKVQRRSAGKEPS